MVKRWGSEAGKARLGCLLVLLVLAVAAYYGVQYFEVQFRYFQIQDEVKTAASYATTLSNDEIRRRLVAKSDSLGLPLGRRQWDIRRSTVFPMEIVISAEYDDSVVIELPGYVRVFRFHFTPGTRAPL